MSVRVSPPVPRGTTTDGEGEDKKCVVGSRKMFVFDLQFTEFWDVIEG